MRRCGFSWIRGLRTWFIVGVPSTVIEAIPLQPTHDELTRYPTPLSRDLGRVPAVGGFGVSGFPGFRVIRPVTAWGFRVSFFFVCG